MYRRQCLTILQSIDSKYWRYQSMDYSNQYSVFSLRWCKSFPPDTTWYYAIFTANNGCIAKDSTLVMVAPEPAPGISLLSDTILCKGLKATLAVINPNPAFRYEWKGINLGPCTANCPVNFNLPEQSSYYQAKAINQYGCSGKDSILWKWKLLYPIT